MKGCFIPRVIVLVYLPLLMVIGVARVWGSDANSCRSDGPNLVAPLHIEEMDRLFDDLTKNIQGYKTDSEVDSYINCWKENDEAFRLYQSKYKRLIKAASSASGVPFSILACLYFYESKYDSKVVSGKDKSRVGAVGMAQIMPKTWNALVKKLEPKRVPSVDNPYVVVNLKKGLEKFSSPMAKSYVEEIDRIYQNHFKESANRSLSGKSNLLKVRELLIKLSEIEKYAKEAPLEQYLSNVESALSIHQAQEMYKKYRTRLGRAKSVLSSKEPEDAAIVGAIHLRLENFPDHFDKKISEVTHDQWILAVGAYNIGAGNFKCKSDESADECIAKTRTKETREHMIGIRNCSERGNLKNKENKSPTACG